MTEYIERLHINNRQKKSHGYLYVARFKDYGHFIAYAPSLNLSGYGDTENEAYDMLFGVVLKDFFDNYFYSPKSKYIKYFYLTVGHAVNSFIKT